MIIRDNFLFILHKTYVLTPQDISDEGSQHMVSRRNKKNFLLSSNTP